MWEIEKVLKNVKKDKAECMNDSRNRAADRSVYKIGRFRVISASMNGKHAGIVQKTGEATH